MMRMTDPDSSTTRQYEFDWLRVVIIANVIVFHAAWLITCVPGFSSVPKGGLAWTVLLDYVLVVAPWHMPVLFFIAGVASRISLSRRAPRKYAIERLKRLLVPLAFGMIFWFPLMHYFWPGVADDRSVSDYLLRYWPECVGRIYSIEVAGQPARPGWGHLWFIAYLLIITLALRPLICRLVEAVPAALRDAVLGALRTRWGVHLLCLPLVAIVAGMSPTWPLYKNSLFGDWAYLSLNTAAFLYGYLLAREETFWATVDVHGLPALPLMLCCGVIVVWYGVAPILEPSYTRSYMNYAIAVGLYEWLAIVALLGLARRYLNRSSEFLSYFARASYPLYFLHLFLMVPIGATVTQWGYGVVLEFALLTALTLVASLVLYHVIVVRFAVTRYLFGLK